ncbi:hypothetical protein C8Q80DRAFT_1222531 [Daedaleopsis nitida]|nr:hypothetical protein C8Q80DRAFT_1222531 [Daedaleopsis nitida]
MVHRPADSRLLTNLLSHEKDYSKHLSILLDYSQASLASFSAYASASAPPASQVIIAVAGALAGADDALRNYAAAVERWQEQLRALKGMEDDFGNIIRDREILVTRLIKATSKQRPTRDSMLGSSPSGSSLSIPKAEVQLGHKMSIAQAELQACEAQLAAKEQELHAFRLQTIRTGLHARCKAMVECGWAWGEMGKEGIRALDILHTPNGQGSPSMHPYTHKPVPYERAPSDVSSIAPSQSASQIGHASDYGMPANPSWRTSSPPVSTPPKPYTLQIPPAHSISEFVVPNGTAQSTIVEETGGSSAEEEGEVPVEVHENPRFSNSKSKEKPKPVPSVPPSRYPHVSFSVRGPKSNPSESSLPSPHSLRGDSPSKKRGRAVSVFGSLATLFRSSRPDAENSTNGSPSKSRNGWQTRIDRNLASARRNGGDSSDDDDAQVSHSYAGPAALSQPPFNLNGDARLKKRTPKRSSVQAHSPLRTVEETEKGYASDTVTESMSKARAKSNKQRTAAKRSTVDGFGGSVRVPGSVGNGNAVAGSSSVGRLKKSPAVNAVFAAEGASLSRNSSISKNSVLSVASAPPSSTAATKTTIGRQSSPPRKRTASLDVQHVNTRQSATTTPDNGHKRTVSTSTSGTPTPTRSTLSNGEPSLLSIVEGISRMNKQAALRQDPDLLLVVPKAPGPINIALSESLGQLPVIRTSPPHRQSHSPPDGSPARSASVRRERQKSASVQQAEENNYRNSLLLAGSVSAPSLPLNPLVSASPNSTPTNQSKPLPKMPLRSALRNPSRTPSPNPPARPPFDISGMVQTQNGSPSSGTASLAPVVLPVQPISAPVIAEIPAPETGPSTAALAMSLRCDSDVSLVSSYETGHEELDDDEPASPAPAPASAPLAPHMSASASYHSPPPLLPEHAQDGSEMSHSTNSTVLTPPADGQGQAPPRRRKSVRMSLPPTFSTTPPAIEDADVDADDRSAGQGPHKHSPWASPGGGSLAPHGWGTRIEANSARDVWQDSSDEDVEYSTAKRMLARFSRRP